MWAENQQFSYTCFSMRIFACDAGRAKVGASRGDEVTTGTRKRGETLPYPWREFALRFRQLKVLPGKGLSNERFSLTHDLSHFVSGCVR